jgi:hypothetical protein
MLKDVCLQVAAGFVCATKAGFSEISRVFLRIATLLKQVDLVQKHWVTREKMDIQRL